MSGSFLIYIYIIYIPRTPMTSIFEGQPPRNKALSIQNKCHVGINCWYDFAMFSLFFLVPIFAMKFVDVCFIY